MAGKNPFYEDDIDDATFLNSGRKSGTGNTNPFYDEAEARREDVLAQIQASEERQLHSQMRCLTSLDESERMGVATAEELLHQREQLNNANRKLDDINQTMTTSQKHINSIKSVFGGIKNWWSKGKDNQSQSKDLSDSKLKNYMDETDEAYSKTPENHPALKHREYADNSSYNTSRYGGSSSSTGNQNQSYLQHQDVFDSNLDMMSSQLSRIKGLGMVLGTEIDEQNKIIEDISTKTEKTDVRLSGQTRQIREILHK